MRHTNSEYAAFACWTCRHGHDAHKIIFPQTPSGPAPYLACKNCTEGPCNESKVSA